jgi:hypothetical protein
MGNTDYRRQRGQMMEQNDVKPISDERNLKQPPGHGGQHSGQPFRESEWSYSDNEMTLNITPEGRDNFYGKGPKGWRHSDERIFEDVCGVLHASPYIDASEVEVSVQDGCVYLRGTVPLRLMKKAAERSVELLPGVEDVQNELRVAVASPHEPK